MPARCSVERLETPETLKVELWFPRFTRFTLVEVVAKLAKLAKLLNLLNWLNFQKQPKQQLKDVEWKEQEIVRGSPRKLPDPRAL